LNTASRKNTAGQQWNADGYAANASFVPALGMPVFSLLALEPGERVLDLGCGDGTLTATLAQTGATVTGVDASHEMIAAARALGLDAWVMDAHALAFDREFDAVFSNAALHWMTDPDAVLAGVRRALKPGGRFVGEFGGHGNVAAIVTALLAALRMNGIDGAHRQPWYFPTAAAYRSKLEQHQFHVESSELIPRPTPLPTGMSGWLRTFANPFLAGLDAEVGTRILAQAEELMAPSLCDDAGNWTADYVRLRFRAGVPIS
jgi:trans-aconitate methyltransferase